MAVPHPACWSPGSAACPRSALPSYPGGFSPHVCDLEQSKVVQSQGLARGASRGPPQTSAGTEPSRAGLASGPYVEREARLGAPALAGPTSHSSRGATTASCAQKMKQEGGGQVQPDGHEAAEGGAGLRRAHVSKTTQGGLRQEAATHPLSAPLASHPLSLGAGRAGDSTPCNEHARPGSTGQAP